MTSRYGRRVFWGLAALVALTQTTCRRHGPADPYPTDLTLAVVAGDGQFGPPSQFLIDSLTVAVRTGDGGLPVDGIPLEWEIAEGPVGAQLTPQASLSDSAGLAGARLRLGSDLGKYVIRASIRDRPEESVDFEAWAVLPPALGALSSGIVNAGDIITLDGTNFSAIAPHNVVLFSGIAGPVIAASTVRLDVIVPPCLPTRSVEVSVWLGGEASTSLPLSVLGSADALDLALGADTTFSVSETPTCLRLGSGSSQEYLAIVQSTATIGAARFDYTFTGLRPGAPTSSGLGSDRVARGRTADHHTLRTPTRRTLRAREGDTVSRGAGSLNAAQAEWDLFLREREALLGVSGFTTGRAAPIAPGGVPVIGDLREFEVLRTDGGFDQVTARVRLVSDRAILYEDRTAEGSLSQEDVTLFAELFNDPIYPVDTGNFGYPSDLDGNGRVIILFTPTVNRLSPPGSDNFVGGFFFGLDLMPNLEHSNAGEVFYILVPDPTGEYGNVWGADLIRRWVSPILAHEFQHMINHNERLIKRGAPQREALWLSEGLAHMAEDLVGEELRKRGRETEADEHQIGNRQRASLFLTKPSDVSVIIAVGQGSLEERGAAWLFLEYLRGQTGSNSVLRSLTGTTLTSTVNVETVMGRDWADLFSDWSAALELERQVLERGPLPLRDELRFRGFDLMEALALSGGFPSTPTLHDSGDFSDQERLWSSSGAYFLIGTGEGGVAVSLSGLNGGPVALNSALRLKLVRLF